MTETPVPQSKISATLADPGRGEHLWTVLTMFRVSNDAIRRMNNGEDPGLGILDHENLITLECGMPVPHIAIRREPALTAPTTTVTTQRPTPCILHADIHPMDADCWAAVLTWQAANDHHEPHETRDAYGAAVERRMLDQFTRVAKPLDGAR